MAHWDRLKHAKFHLLTEMVAEMVSHSYDIFASDVTEELTMDRLVHLYTFTQVGRASSFRGAYVLNVWLCHRCRSHSCFHCR